MNKHNRGSALIEAVIAMTAIIVVIAAIATVLTLSINSSSFENNQNIANKSAQDAIEYFKTIHMRNRTIDLDNGASVIPVSLRSVEGTFCFGDDLILRIESCTPNVGGSYIRSVSFTQGSCGNPPRVFDGGTEMRVNVSWVSGKCSESNRFCHNSTLVSCISHDGTVVQP